MAEPVTLLRGVQFVRIVFLGRRNFANHCFANWLAKHHHVVAYFAADAERYTGTYRLRWFNRRMRRGGLLRTIDQTLYQIYYSLFQVSTNSRLKQESFAAAFGSGAFSLPNEMPVYTFADLNGDEAMRALARLEPDLVFAVCISQYLRDGYRRTPRLGTVLYHEGLTPEYKGLHTAFWANLRGEAHRIGYTLLQLNEAIDAGRPLAQGVGTIDPQLAHWWNWAGHQALIDGLPDVQRALAALAAGAPPAVDTNGRPEMMWTYPGLSDEMRRVWRAWRPRNGDTANGHTGNGHTGNGHAGNGHAANGHAGNGHAERGANETREHAGMPPRSS